MAKVAKTKKRDVSIHSRAARRGESGLDKGKAARDGRVEESDYKPWLHNAEDAGVGKKKKTRQLTRQQRLRQEKGLEKAEVNLDKLDKKVADSNVRGKKVNARRIDWDELNEKLPETGIRVKKAAEPTDDTRPMEDVVAPDALQPVSIRTVGLVGSGADVTQTPNVSSTTHPIAAAPPPLEEDVDEVT